MVNPLVALAFAAVITAVILWLFWPERGIFWRWQQGRQMTRRVLIEDALKHIHHCEYHGRTPTVQSIAGALHTHVDEIAELMNRMNGRGLIEFEGDKLRLTPAGQDYARHIIRAHRLWERYLADKTGYAATEWHSQSDRREHQLTPAQADALASELGHPLYDPHGDPIPTATGDLIPAERVTLPNLSPHTPARITHLEDEPETVYAQLVAEGIHLGMTVLVTETTPQRVRFWANGDAHVLAPILAANISVAPIRQEEHPPVQDYESLSKLTQGETAKVINISQNIRGAERRRFMDLGILPGTMVKAELISPSGDPTAYRIRGALIGLRKEQADSIHITRDMEAAQ